MPAAHPDASWNPAFRPDSISSAIDDRNDEEPSRSLAFSPDSVATEPREDVNEILNTADGETSGDIETCAPGTPPRPVTPVDVAQEEDDISSVHELLNGNEEHPELPNLRKALTTSLGSPGGIEMDNNPTHVSDTLAKDGDHDIQVQHEKAGLPSSGPGHVNGHTSTISFTRTVGDDVDWGEDDEVDPEWNIQSTDAAPFRSMSASDRTNSFPAVPPTHLPASEAAVHDYPRSEAEEIMFGDDKDAHQEPFNQPQKKSSHKVKHSIDWGTPDDNATDYFSFGMTLGGDVIEGDTDASRYEEGVPLVQSTHLNAPAKKHQKKFSTSKIFADDEYNDDGSFFANIGSGSTEQDTNQAPLLRRSTSQFLDSIHYDAQEETDGVTTPDGNGGQRLTSIDMTSGGGIAASKSTLMSQVAGEKYENYENHADGNPFQASKPSEEDLAAKWQAALDLDEFLDEDEDFLPADIPEPTSELDPAAVFGSDDEGFLDDEEPADSLIAPVSEGEGQISSFPRPVTDTNGNIIGFDQLTGTAQENQWSTRNRYVPSDTAQAVPQQHRNLYSPDAPLLTDLTGQPNSATMYGATPPATLGSRPGSSGYQTQPQIPQVPGPELASKAQSFADKAKGGYSSPYDLPMDVTKPRKRVSMQQMANAYTQPQPPAAPPRSASMYTPAQPQQTYAAIASPPMTSGSLASPNVPAQAPPPAVKQGPPTLKSKASFFEELPVVAKSRPSRPPSQPISPALHGHPGFGVGGHPQSPPMGPPQVSPSLQSFAAPPPTSHGLVSPPPVTPYSPMVTQEPKVAPVNTRYSPAPAQQQPLAPAPPPQGRYAATPPLVRQTIPPYSAVPLPPNPPFAHQPRTSSPLAHFERSSEQEPPTAPPPHAGYGRPGRRESSSYSGTRDGHLPLAREVAEHAASERRRSHDQDMYSPQESLAPPHHRAKHTSSLQQPFEPSLAKPQVKRALSYAPENREPLAEVDEPPFQPPKRSQTQSPGTATYGPQANLSTREPYAVPPSIHSPTSPPRPDRAYAPITTEAPAAKTRGRAFSQGLSYITPTDGRQHDPLQRWRGGPVFVWGIGTIVTSFPKEVPRYGIGSNIPMIQPSPGEVKVRNMKDIYPLEGPMACFPGPLKGKGKKKDVVSWLSVGIDALERDNGYLGSLPTLSHNDKRKEERAILWKILRVLVEHDGVLEGTTEVDKAARAVLCPGLDDDSTTATTPYTIGADLTGIYRAPGSIPLAEPVDPVAVDDLRKQLLRGDREKAVWTAVDNRLWAHALLISNTLSADLYKRVAQEFIQKEVKNIGENTESLAALYEVFAGNHEEIVDELVPPSARAGFQMVSASAGTSPSKSAIDGLDRWRETLSLVLSNRSADDNKAIQALGKLLAGYGRAEAAHVCFLFSRTNSLFGGIDDPNSDIVLIGSDHQRQPYDFDKDIESVLLSEVYEYGLSLSGTSHIPTSVPHLSVYKLQHAKILADFGQRTRALDYCEFIASSITSQTRRSPYHHSLLVSELDDLSKRLKQSPKDEPSSWISKPSIDKVSSSVWTKFNKFVAGDEKDEMQHGGAEGGAEVGPFARIAGGTPTISRSPSVADIYAQHNTTHATTNGAIPIPTSTMATSRYAPGGSYPSLNPLQPTMGSSYGSQPGSSYGASFGHQPPVVSGQQYPGSDSRAISSESQDSRYAPASHPEYPQATQHEMNYVPTTHPEHSQQYQSSYAPPPQEYYAPENNHSHPPKPDFGQNRLSNHDEPQPRRVSEDIPSSGGYAPPAMSSYEPPAPNAYAPLSVSYEAPASTSYSPPEHTGYTPPSYEPNQIHEEPDSSINTMPKKKGFMDDDEDTLQQASRGAREQTKAEKDREADEAFRKAAEEDGKHLPFFTPLFLLRYANNIQRNAPHLNHKRKPGVSSVGSRRKTLLHPRNNLSLANLSKRNWERQALSTMIRI